MLLGTIPTASAPLGGAPRLPRPYKTATVGESGWAAWSYSRQAKLNAWAWHGLGSDAVLAWASLGNIVYVRKESDSYVHTVQPDTFLQEGEQNTESTRVEATTQWLDFGKPGKMKALSGLDCDVLGVTAVEVYVFIPNPDNPRDRTPTLAASIPLADAAAGWTYNGEVIPLEVAATEFMVRMVGDPGAECQVNRLTLHYEEISG